jgi:hypothetical protein
VLLWWGAGAPKTPAAEPAVRMRTIITGRTALTAAFD